MRELYVAYNKFDVTESNVFTNTKSSFELDLSFNELTKILGNTFSGTKINNNNNNLFPTLQKKALWRLGLMA